MSKYNLSIEEENRLYEKINRISFICVLLTVALVFLIILSVNLLKDRNRIYDNHKSDIAEYINLKEVAHDNGYYIFYDKNTKVMYYQIRYAGGEFVMSPIINMDGTPKLYEGD